MSAQRQAVAKQVDVVVVSYNSAGELRDCVQPLAGQPALRVIAVDNASTDSSLDTLAGLDVDTLPLESNGGFGRGCNVGWSSGDAPYVLFLNPDARISPGSIAHLAAILEERPNAAAVAPRITEADGSLDYSLRRFPRLRSTYARALFLHRLFPAAGWTDELVRDPKAYREPGSPDWASGACLLVRRSALEQLGGFDEGFFMYCEDVDLCRRLWDAGHELLYDPDATVSHLGGASAPRTSLLPVLAASRLRYAAKHRRPASALLERGGIALEALTHIVVSGGGRAARAGHARALVVALTHSART